MHSKISKLNIKGSRLKFLALATVCTLSFSAPAICGTELEEMMVKAHNGDSSAENHLGEMYMHGNGVKKDYAEALKWFIRAAEHGNAYAANHLGILYSKGKHVPENHKEAVKWMQIAADRGNPSAQFNLAIAYEEGNGIKQNIVEAYVWAALANGAPDIEPANKTIFRDTFLRIKDNLTKEQLEEGNYLLQKRKEELMQKNGADLVVVPGVATGS